MINTYNETHLHKTLKNLYAQNENAKTEVKTDNSIYDILTPEGNVIEIQTQNLSKLTAKLQKALSLNRKCRVIYPLVVEKIIQTENKEGKIISKRKSPKKQTIYNIFRELTGIYPILLNKNFTLEVLLVKTTEIRTNNIDLINEQNTRRKFKKDWVKIDKRLNEIIDKIIFYSKKDYLNLLPQNLPENFSSKELKQELKNLNLTKTAYNSANLMLWVYKRMEIIEFTEKKGRTNYFRIK